VYCNRDRGASEVVYAPVVDKTCLRIFLTLVVAMGWFLEQGDVCTAFLNAPVKGDIYVKLPGGIYTQEDMRIRKLNKALYGLKQAPKQWNETFTAWATEEGRFVQSANDPCLFIHSTLKAAIVLYVDDLLIGAESQRGISTISEALASKFKMRMLGEPKVFLGMQIKYDRKKKLMSMSQQQYIDELVDRFGVGHLPPRNLPMNPAADLHKLQDGETMTAQPYSSLVGALMFLSVCTRPDISFAVHKLAQYLSKPGERHWEAAVSLLRYLKGTREMGIRVGSQGGRGGGTSTTGSPFLAEYFCGGVHQSLGSLASRRW
jgi:hypothetical protein